MGFYILRNGGWGYVMDGMAWHGMESNGRKVNEGKVGLWKMGRLFFDCIVWHGIASIRGVLVFVSIQICWYVGMVWYIGRVYYINICIVMVYIGRTSWIVKKYYVVYCVVEMDGEWDGCDTH